jgi:hypothetical protein
MGRPDALSGFLEVVHRLFEDGVFVGHDLSIRAGIARSPDCFAFSREHSGWELLRNRGRMKGLLVNRCAGYVPGYVRGALWANLWQPNHLSEIR